MKVCTATRKNISAWEATSMQKSDTLPAFIHSSGTFVPRFRQVGEQLTRVVAGVAVALQQERRRVGSLLADLARAEAQFHRGLSFAQRRTGRPTGLPDRCLRLRRGQTSLRRRRRGKWQPRSRCSPHKPPRHAQSSCRLLHRPGGHTLPVVRHPPCPWPHLPAKAPRRWPWQHRARALPRGRPPTPWRTPPRK
eukprot:scaffold3076_cov248-Pinguiococcus_pyrenoidosus.AAC.4